MLPQIIIILESHNQWTRHMLLYTPCLLRVFLSNGVTISLLSPLLLIFNSLLARGGLALRSMSPTSSRSTTPLSLFPPSPPPSSSSPSSSLLDSHRTSYTMNNTCVTRAVRTHTPRSYRPSYGFTWLLSDKQSNKCRKRFPMCFTEETFKHCNCLLQSTTLLAWHLQH